MSGFNSNGAQSSRRGLAGLVLSLIFAAAVLPAAPAAAARDVLPALNTLSLGSVSAATGADAVVPLGLANEDVVGGIQLDVVFDPTVVAFVTATAAPRAAGMTVASSVPELGRMRVVMYFGGGQSLPAGTGAVANLTFHVWGAAGAQTSLTPDAAELADPTGQALANPVTVSGSISVSGGAATDSLTVGSGSGASGTEVTVALGLRNSVAVQALQLDLRFVPSVVEWVAAASTARVGGMTLVTEPQGADSMRIVMYFADANAIAPGEGAVATLTFRLVGAGGSSSPLILGGVVVSDPQGHEVEVATRNGILQVTGGPADPTGACCAAGGECTVTTEAACSAGTWHGADTDCTPNPCPLPVPPDTLSVGGGTGPAGGQITIPISLTNRAGVRGLQADVVVDPNVLEFETGAAGPRAANMRLATSALSPSRVRLFMYFDTNDSLPAGQGTVADLVFRIHGTEGNESSLAPLEIKIADRNNHEVAAVGRAGLVVVAPGAAPPGLHVMLLKNPGRERTLQVFVTSDVALDAPPAVTLSGGTPVPVTAIAGVNIYQGTVSLGDEVTTATVSATGLHGGASGTTQTTVTF